MPAKELDRRKIQGPLALVSDRLHYLCHGRDVISVGVLSCRIGVWTIKRERL